VGGYPIPAPIKTLKRKHMLEHLPFPKLPEKLPTVLSREEVSFSLYLWQGLFLPGPTSELARGGFRYLHQPGWNLLAILACACLSRCLIEISMPRLGHRVSAPSLALPGAVASSPAHS
jgi:hypothetical protein